MKSPDQRAAVFSALGDQHRLAVVDLLQAGDLSPDAIASSLGMPGNLLAHHLKVLEEAGVISRSSSQHDKRRTYVHLNSSAMTQLLPQPRELSVPRIVFACTHNSARSILADALWRTVSDVPSTSAGTRPADQINPRAKAAAARHRLTLTQRTPQLISDVLRDDDLIISVCDSVNEELLELKNERLHWSIPDPSLVDTDEAFTQALHDIRARVEQLASTVRVG